LQAARRVVLTLPAKAEYVALSRLATSGLGSGSGMPEDVVDDLKVAVSEACSYFIQEAPAEDETDKSALQPDRDAEELRIEYELGDEVLQISISGCSDVRADGTVEVDPFSEFGLGMTIVRALVDKLELSEAPESRTLLRLTKRLK